MLPSTGSDLIEGSSGGVAGLACGGTGDDRLAGGAGVPQGDLYGNRVVGVSRAPGGRPAVTAALLIIL